MKDFFKYMLATMLAMVIMGAFAMVMSFVMLLSVAAAGEQKPVIADGSVLRLSLNGLVNERTAENPFAKLLGNEMLQEHTVAEGEHLVLTSDKTFSSPSTAAMFVLGRPSNGWMDWKDNDGNTLDSVSLTTPAEVVSVVSSTGILTSVIR